MLHGATYTLRAVEQVKVTSTVSADEVNNCVDNDCNSFGGDIGGGMQKDSRATCVDGHKSRIVSARFSQIFQVINLRGLMEVCAGTAGDGHIWRCAGRRAFLFRNSFTRICNPVLPQLFKLRWARHLNPQIASTDFNYQRTWNRLARYVLYVISRLYRVPVVYGLFSRELPRGIADIFSS